MLLDPQPLPRLFADAMLGGLARWLRVLDFDVAYDPRIDDPELVELAVAEGRTILTRDRKLTERRLARNHLLIASGKVEEQVRQVLEAFGVRPDPLRLLQRCLVCNLPMEPIEADRARTLVPPFVARTQREFRICPGCARIYWHGTHAARMEGKLEKMGLGLQSAKTPG